MLQFLVTNSNVFALCCCGVGIVLAILLACGIKKVKVEDGRMKEISGYIKDGAMAYLTRQYSVLVIFLIIMCLALFFVYNYDYRISIAFLFGAALSILAGYLGMRTAVISNVRTTAEAQHGIARAFRTAFSGGAVMGILVVSLGALGVSVVSLLTNANNILTGFSLGASSVALFCRVGGGIYTKAADVGADLVGKVEAGIPEDDPKNPAVIADNVGDNVGDVAGMGADLFESYVGCIVAALLLASANITELNGAPFVMLTVAGGLLASVIGIVITRLIKTKNAAKSLNIGTYTASALIILITLCLSLTLGKLEWFWAALCGIIAGTVIGKITEIYTSAQYKTVKEIAAAGETGSATNILTGYSAGLKSTAIPLIIIVAAIVIAFAVSGNFGIVLAALGMLATVGMVISVDAYGPIADNAGGIAEMSGCEESVRDITDNLDSVGNTTAAIGKGFSIGSAALTALALIVSYAHTVNLDDANMALTNPNVLCGLLIGGMLAFLFSALTISSVSRAANDMINEVRSQFKNNPGILEGKVLPDYKRCVSISTKAAIREMILPGIIAIVAPIAVGLILKPEGLAGLLVGATVTGVLLAISMSNSGGAWDNAKKFIENGNHGGKNSPAHKAAVIGDTVGDPFKDTAGPSLNILIKLMSMVALVFAPLFLNF